MTKTAQESTWLVSELLISAFIGALIIQFGGPELVNIAIWISCVLVGISEILRSWVGIEAIRKTVNWLRPVSIAEKSQADISRDAKRQNQDFIHFSEKVNYFIAEQTQKLEALSYKNIVRAEGGIKEMQAQIDQLREENRKLREDFLTFKSYSDNQFDLLSSAVHTAESDHKILTNQVLLALKGFDVQKVSASVAIDLQNQLRQTSEPDVVVLSALDTYFKYALRDAEVMKMYLEALGRGIEKK